MYFPVWIWVLTECLGALSYPAEVLGSVPATHCSYHSGTLHLGVSCNMSETVTPFRSHGESWPCLTLVHVMPNQNIWAYVSPAEEMWEDI